MGIFLSGREISRFFFASQGSQIIIVQVPLGLFLSLFYLIEYVQPSSYSGQKNLNEFKFALTPVFPLRVLQTTKKGNGKEKRKRVLFLHCPSLQLVTDATNSRKKTVFGRICNGGMWETEACLPISVLLGAFFLQKKGWRKRGQGAVSDARKVTFKFYPGISRALFVKMQ